MKLNGERVIDKTINLILIIIGIVSIYPIWFVLIASVSSPMAISAGEVVLFPKGLNIDAYKKLFAREDVWIGYRNSIFYTSLGTMINLVVQMPLAYALSRKTLPGRTVINTLLVITMYFSGGIIPSYLLISKLGLHDTVWALALPGAVSVYNVIVAKNFFAGNVPESLHDAACIDGCGYTHFFCRVVLPLSKSIMAIIAMFSIQGHWNSYLEPRMYLRTKSKYTLQQVVQSIAAALDSSLISAEGTDLREYLVKMQEKQLMKYAVVVVAAAPLVIVYPLVQKYLVKGVMIGAVKG